MLETHKQQAKLYSSTDESNMDAILLAQYAICHRPAVRSSARYRSAIHVETRKLVRGARRRPLAPLTTGGIGTERVKRWNLGDGGTGSMKKYLLPGGFRVLLNGDRALQVLRKTRGILRLPQGRRCMMVWEGVMVWEGLRWYGKVYDGMGRSMMVWERSEEHTSELQSPQ